MKETRTEDINCGIKRKNYFISLHVWERESESEWEDKSNREYKNSQHNFSHSRLNNVKFPHQIY